MQLEKEGDGFVERLIIYDEDTIHINGNVRICGTEQPHTQIEHQCDSLKVSVFLVVSREKAHGPFFFT
jgi:hypothetical protein